MQLLCDADASGAEVAQYEVYLPKGKIVLCGHHMQSSWPAMKETGGIVALRIDAIDGEAFGILSFYEDDDHGFNSAMDGMQAAMLESRPAFPASIADPFAEVRESDEWWQGGNNLPAREHADLFRMFSSL